MGKVTFTAKALKALGLSGKAAKGGAASLKLGALGGLSAFFGFEWLTNGGLVRGIGGALGITELASSFLIVGVVIGALCLLFYYLSKRVSRPRKYNGGRN